MTETLPAAYGGSGWRARQESHIEDVTCGVWRSLGAPSEVATLREVVLARPSAAALAGYDAEELLFVSMPNPERWSACAAALGHVYERFGVTVHWADSCGSNASANFVFQRDLFFRTPEGAILGRPASRQRAVEARWAAATLAALGVPILAIPRGCALFECADALWLDPRTVLVGIGARTDVDGFAFVAAVLNELGVRAVPIELPGHVQHLLGILNFVDTDLAVVRRCSAFDAVSDVLSAAGVAVIEYAECSQANAPLEMNFVTLAPRRVLMDASGRTLTDQLAAAGIEVVPFDASEYGKAAGGLACASGILRRA